MRNKLLKGYASMLVMAAVLASAGKVVSYQLDVSDANDLCNNIAWSGQNIENFQEAINDSLDKIDTLPEHIDEDGLMGNETRRGVVKIFRAGGGYHNGAFTL